MAVPMVEQVSEQIKQTLNGASRIPGIMAYPTVLLVHEQGAKWKMFYHVYHITVIK